MTWRWLIAAAVVTTAAAQEAPVTEGQTEPDPPIPISGDCDAVREEVVALRRQIDKLQTTIDVYINGMVAELQDENTRLRRLLRRTYGDEPETLPAVPTPDRDLLEDAMVNPDPAAFSPAQDAPPPAELTYTTVTEWGRSVEEAARIGDDVQSLKGMILAVPDGTTDAQLRELAGTLRREYDGFDNINIEVFETIEAAKTYAEGNATAGQERVLSISKHAGSGRDLAVIIRGDRTEEIPLASP